MTTHIPIPTQVTYANAKQHEWEIVIEPCYPGYGMTLGNALRRVLLSSLPGAAVTAVKIEGIQHEYDSLDNIKEDVIEILMNLKHLRVTSHSDDPVTLTLSAKGEKKVTAGDIKKNSQAEVVNKDLVIATLTDKKAELSMDITVKRGIGYEPVEERMVDKKEIGTIQIDARYSPVLNVGFRMENVRVGQRTDFEKIILTMKTDGSLNAGEAVSKSVEILQDQFAAVVAARETAGDADNGESEDDTNESDSKKNSSTETTE